MPLHAMLPGPIIEFCQLLGAHYHTASRSTEILFNQDTCFNAGTRRGRGAEGP